MLPALHLRLGPAPPPRAEPTEGCRENLQLKRQQLKTRLDSILSKAGTPYKAELGGENLKEYNRVEWEIFYIEQRLRFFASSKRNDGDCLFSDPLQKKKGPEDLPPKSALVKRSLPNPNPKPR